jgi:HSP20 family protein
MDQKSQQGSANEEQRLQRRENAPASGRVGLLERFSDEMDRIFDDFGFGRSWMSPRWSAWRGTSPGMWSPAIEVHQQDHDLVIHADLPGLKKEDLKLDISEDAVTIEGERRKETSGEEGGFYRSERSYGRFCRTIALPEGAMTDQAKATFANGVLEIRMPSPPEQTRRGRRLEISESSTSKK